MTINVTEGAFSGLGKVAGKRKWRARLIGVGTGASAVYTEEALRGSFAEAFPAGTRVNINHQSYQENAERNLEQLAGALCSTPVFESDGMYADVEFSEKWAPFIEEFHEVIGLSISGACTVATGSTDDGTWGVERGLPIVDKFVYTPLNTVDVVTAPGANGRFIEALESYRGNMTVESNQPKGDEFTVRPEDIAAISTAVSEALKNVLDKRDKEKADKAKAEDQAKLDAAKADEEEKKKKEKKTKESIANAVEAIADADLPSAFRRRVAEGFARGEDVKELIKEQVELIESARSEQGVRPRSADGGDDFDKKFKELEW